MPVRLALALLLAAPAGAQDATLRATLDLRGPLADGWLEASDVVGLRGDRAPLTWGQTLPAADPDGDGLYDLDVEIPVAADSVVLELKIKADVEAGPNGGWQLGDNHAVVLRPGETTALALAWADRASRPAGVLTGRIDTVEGVEAEGLAPRDVYVWLPPGYADGDRRYPVLYLHDGASMFGHGGGGEWGVDEAATALVAAGEIEPLIVVAVANTGARTDEYTPTRREWRRDLRRVGAPTGTGALAAHTGAFETDAGERVVVREVEGGGLEAQMPGGVSPAVPQEDGTFSLRPDITVAFERGADGAIVGIVARRPPAGGLADAYGRLLTDTVKPLVDARYRTRPDAASTGLGGSSLGGLVTMHLGLTRPDVFGRLIVASPSVWWDDKAILRAVEASAGHPEQRVWVDVGLDEGDSMVPDARALHGALLEAGWDPARVRYVEAPGAGHSGRAWAARAPDMLRFLFPPE